MLIFILYLFLEEMRKTFNNEDAQLVSRAVEIAEEGLKHGGGPFGAIIKRGDTIISESYNKVVVSGDPTAHAEILAIRQASEIVGSHDLSDCVMYSSCEPCPMCMGAIYWAGIKTVFYGSGREDAASAGFNDDYIYKELELDPEKRELFFYRVKEIDSNRVFRAWEKLENRKTY